MGRRLLWDVETNGLLPTMDRIHCLHIIDVDTLEKFAFRNNKAGNDIADGVAMLEAADMWIGHNIIGFDIKAVAIVYPHFHAGDIEIRDTLVMVRLLPIDFKPLDFAANKQGRLPAKMIGKHSLDSWGYRLGKRKGDYAKEMQAKGLDPWSEWNQEMDDYCENDIDVNILLWNFIEKHNVSLDTIDMEQATQEVVTYMEHTGFPFKLAEAEVLAQKLQSEMAVKVQAVVEKRCGAFAAEKKYVISPLWNDPKGLQAKKAYKPPREEWGEDYSRKWWAEITIPKKDAKSKDPTKRGDRTAGGAYCKMKWKPFSPTSRDQVIDFLTDDFAWHPTEWTKTGRPSVDDTVLRAMGERHPICNELADIFQLQKLLGYISNGSEAWIKKFDKETGAVHCYINIGGTVTGRASHHGPNLGQVPSVQLDKDDHPILGLKGKYGYECRSLFYVPETVEGEPWVQVGADLSGIEFRCLADAMSPYDGGEMIEVIASGQDIHAYNMSKTGIDSRSTIKRGLYGLLYGAGDPKIGATIAADLDSSQWAEAGRRFRQQLMDGLPALNSVIKETQAQAQKGFIYGLDGRKVPIRSEHAALNTRLQGAGALIAKRWLVFTEDYAMAEGLNHGWHGDFAMLAFVHDEIQSAARSEVAEEFAALCIEAAADAGSSFGMSCPIGAEFKIGHNWAECH